MLYIEINKLLSKITELESENTDLKSDRDKYKVLYEDRLDELKWYYQKYGKRESTLPSQYDLESNYDTFRSKYSDLKTQNHGTISSCEASSGFEEPRVGHMSEIQPKNGVSELNKSKSSQKILE